LKLLGSNPARAFVAALALAAAPAQAHGLEVSVGGAYMANLYNVIRVGATDVQVAWSHDFAWSSVRAGGEWLAFFPTGHVDPAIGLRLGWSVFRDVGPVRPRVGLSAGAYWTHVSPVLPVGYLDLALEKPLDAWTFGLAASGMVSLFGAGVQPRLYVTRTF
jgi:hypothetical protein